MMRFHNSTAEVFVPDGRPLAAALRRVTHLGIGAHQDDLEFMAFHGIAECHGKKMKWFGGVTCTDGAGSARAGRFKKFTDEQMKTVRRREQNRAARLGDYGVMIQLDYPSRAVKRPRAGTLKEDLKAIIAAIRPEVIYTHNPADKHDTHVGVVVAVMQALRELPKAVRPKQVIGCEVWRGLDWLPDPLKVVMDVSGHDRLAARLNGVFASQIAGGKRYDRAILGRRSANATFFDSHTTDRATQVIFGMDLTPLMRQKSGDLAAYTLSYLDALRKETAERLRKSLG